MDHKNLTKPNPAPQVESLGTVLAESSRGFVLALLCGALEQCSRILDPSQWALHILFAECTNVQ